MKKGVACAGGGVRGREGGRLVVGEVGLSLSALRWVETERRVYSRAYNGRMSKLEVNYWLFTNQFDDWSSALQNKNDR